MSVFSVLIDIFPRKKEISKFIEGDAMKRTEF